MIPQNVCFAKLQFKGIFCQNFSVHNLQNIYYVNLIPVYQET